MQIIKCDVYSCKYCDCDKNKCTLDEIRVSNKSNNTNKEATLCDSYKKIK